MISNEDQELIRAIRENPTSGAGAELEARLSFPYPEEYFEHIGASKSRFEAALWIMAWAAMTGARAKSMSLEGRVTALERADRHAEALVRDYQIDDDTPCPEDQHPWRKWLWSWGYARKDSP